MAAVPLLLRALGTVTLHVVLVVAHESPEGPVLHQNRRIFHPAAFVNRSLLDYGVSGQSYSSVTYPPPNSQSWGDKGYCAANYPGPFAQAPFDRPEKWVDAHNHYRACHGAPDLVWEPRLVPHAKRWVEAILTHCEGIVDVANYKDTSPPDQHRPHDPQCYTTELPKNGENLAFFDGPVKFLPTLLQATAYTPESATVEAWYREVETDCQAEGFVPGCGTIDHFTALIWSSVTRLGCYSGVRGGFKIISCRYSPALDDGGAPCDLPNVIGCQKERIPALVAGRCHPIPGSEIPSLALPIGKGQPGVPEPRIALPLPQVFAMGEAIVDFGRSIWEKLSNSVSGLTSRMNGQSFSTTPTNNAAYTGPSGSSGYSRLYSDTANPSSPTNTSLHNATTFSTTAWVVAFAGLSSVICSIYQRTFHSRASNTASSAETELHNETSLLVAI